MYRKLAILAALIAAFAFTTQSADAHWRGHHHSKKKLAAVAIGVGAASTATYFAINNWHTNGWNNSSGLTSLGAWSITTLGCAAVSPMVGTLVLNRPLTYREAHTLIGSCVIPIVGGWLVDQAYRNHVLWAPDEKQRTGKRHHRRHHHKM
jgi:hypothetical protein